MLRRFPKIAISAGKCGHLRFAICLGCVILLLPAPARALQKAVDGAMRKISGETMGTTYHITIDAGAQAELGPIDMAEIKQAVDDRLADINRKMSTYDPSSEVSRFNQSRQTDWFAVSAETALVVEQALQIHQASHGAFDITVGPLVNAWGFGPRKTSDTGQVPSGEAIQAMLEYVGSSKLEVRRDPPAIRKSHPQVEIDLSAIAKGYGVDAIAELLVVKGLDRHLVEIGGEVRAGKRKTVGTFWHVGIESPRPELREISRIVELENLSLASSGNYRNFLMRGGKSFGHTIDPRTGLPVEKNILGASIVADNCMQADAMATACMVLGVAESLKFANDQGSQVLVFYAEQEQIRGTHSEGFPLFGGESLVDVEELGRLENEKGSTFLPIFVAAAAVFLIAIFIMSLGTIVGNRRIKGSCGALASSSRQDVTSPCELCQKPVKDCPEKQSPAAK